MPEPSYYLSLTIGPIYRTIQRARKTRELWAASFILSQWMELLLLKFKDYGTVLSPDPTPLGKGEKLHGAGIWNDNCFIEIADKQNIEAIKEAVPGFIAATKEELCNWMLSEGKFPDVTGNLKDSELRDTLMRHFVCHAVILQHDGTGLPALPRLGELMGAAEMQHVFPQQHDNLVGAMLFRPETVHLLYDRGFAPNDIVFTHYKNEKGEEKRRMPSLLEVATREFKKHTNLVEDVITDQVRAYQNHELDYEDGNEDENQAIIKELKALKGDLVAFKKRHKYIAVVQSDGDGVGRILREVLGNDTSKITKFSKELMEFAREAVKEIAHFGGIPVYAGGDDLLFIAPLRNQENKSIFDLTEKIRGIFKSKPVLHENGATLSFGISVSYYKFPLGEALEHSRNLLQQVAKKLTYGTIQSSDGKKSPAFAKNALAFSVLIHGGQAFGAVFNQDSTTYKTWTKMIHDNLNADPGFLGGVVQTLEKLELFLDAACDPDPNKRYGSPADFFDQNFNEIKTARDKKFIQDVQDFTLEMFRDYRGELPNPIENADFYRLQFDTAKGNFKEKTIETRFRNNLLYSALRMVQFLNADDHE